MGKKNILIISYSYPPSNAPAAQRPYAFAKYIDKSNYNVTVITCGNADSSLGFDASFESVIEDVALIKIDSRVGANIGAYRNASMASSSNKNSFKSKIKKYIFTTLAKFVVPDKAIFWYPNVISYLKTNKALLEKIDIVFTTSPLFTNHLIGNYIKQKNKKINWLADFRDFHYIENMSKKNNFIAKLNKRLEQKIIQRADKITFISDAMQKVYEGYYYNDKHKMHFVYNGYDKEDFDDLIIEKVVNDKFTVFYAGSFYKGIRSPLPLLQLLDKSFKMNYITPNDVLIKIAGNFEQELLQEAKMYSSFSCIEFLGNIPRSEVLVELTKSDVLWLIVGNKTTHYTGVPIKFYEYLAARRPIINFAPKNSEPTKIIEQLNLGVSFNSKNFDVNIEFNKFKKILEDYKEGSLQLPLNPSLTESFTRDKQALIFQKIIE